MNGLDTDWMVKGTRVSPTSYTYPSAVVRQMPKRSGSAEASSGM